MRNGVPYDVAFSLGDRERAAYAIVLSQFEGGRFDWETFTFKKPED